MRRRSDNRLPPPDRGRDSARDVERWSAEILDRLGEALYGLDAQGRLRFASRRALEIWGLPAEQVIGRPLVEVLPAIADTDTWAAIERGYRNGEESRLCDVSAVMGRWIEVHIHPVSGGGVIVSLRDIEDRRRAVMERELAVQALARNERYYRALAEMGAAAHWRARPDGYILESRGWEVLTGQSAEDLRGDGWTRLLHPEDVAAATAAWKEAVETQQPVKVDYRLRTRAGAWLWVRARAVPVRDERGRMIGWSGVVEDIDAGKRAETALRESEARFQRAVEAAQVGTWEWDAVNDVITGSPGREERLLGRPTGFIRNLATALEAVHPEDRDMVRQALQRVISRETDEYEAEFRTVWPNGSIRWLRSIGRATAGPDGRVRNLSGVTLDVTNQVQARQRHAVLAHEVDHRAKNLLAVVQAMLLLTPLDRLGAAEALKARVAALARAHSLLAEVGWTDVELADLVRAELTGFATRPVELTGPVVRLRPGAVQPLAMVLHELAANAVKFGALAGPDGRVSVTWLVTGQGGPLASLVLQWREEGGPAVSGSPAHRGFGTRVIENTIRAQLGGTIQRHWNPAGFACEITLPLGRVASAEPG